MRSVKADKKIYKLSADPEYRAKHPYASMVKKRIGEIERGRRINPIFDKISVVLKSDIVSLSSDFLILFFATVLGV